MGPSAQQSSFPFDGNPLVSSSTNHEPASAIAPHQYDAAIALLRSEDDGAIFAYLKLARSLPQNFHRPPNHACLTRDQVRAIEVLRHCNNSDISARLHRARTSTSSHLYDGAPDQILTPPSVLSLASTPGPFDPSPNNAANHRVPTQGPLAQPFPTATVSPSQATPKYYCTICSYKRPFKNQSDWRKHEREHDTTYICMLKGPREATPHAWQCWFCGFLDPPDDHLSTHDVQTCLHGPPNSFSSKRRHEMVNHLIKVHGVTTKSHGETIAVKWKHTVEKQAWSCGFCVIAFTTFNDRLGHIATQHFEHGRTIGEWDTTKVIQGLLLQPGMVKAWEDKLAVLPTWEVIDIIWEKDAIIGLQHDLEVGPNDKKSAADLAEEAYTACRFNWGVENQRGMAATEGNPDETSIATSFSPNYGSDDFQSLSAIQEFNLGSTTSAVTQTIDSSSYGNGSTLMAHSNNSGSEDLAAPPSYFQQTQSVITHRAYDDTRYGGPGNDDEEERVWFRNAGSICDTKFDTYFE